MSTDHCQRLFAGVAGRLRLATFGRAFAIAALVLIAIYAVLFLAGRSLALLPDWSAWWLFGIPGAAIVIAAALARRPDRQHVARTVDAALGTHDLFLADTTLDTAPGEYRTLVRTDAQRRASQADAGMIVPLRWGRSGSHAAAAGAALALAVLVLPATDPFGLNLQREHRAERDQRVAEQRERTKERKAALLAKQVEAANSKAVEVAVDQLEQTFATLKKNEAEQNQKRLDAQQKALGQQWRAARSDGLKQLDGAQPLQRFGNDRKRREWENSLSSGSPESLKQELRDILNKLDDADNAQTPSERRKKLADAKRQLRELAEFLRQKTGSEQFQDALARALEQVAQLDRSASGELEQALRETLELSQLEADKLAQQLRDLEKLEQALRAVQMAKALNQKKDGLDGGECKDCQGLGDYEALYEQWLQSLGMGMSDKPGPGMGGPGVGEGNVAQEDESQKTDFETEKSPSKLTAGRLLLQLDNRGVSDAGERERQYAEQVEQLQQNASEAIRQEQIPPGYHAAIKRYFDALERTKKKR